MTISTVQEKEWSLQVNKIMDTSWCPHIATRIVFQHSGHNMNLYKLLLNDKEKEWTLFQQRLSIWHNLKHMFDKKVEIREKITRTLCEINTSLSKEWYATNWHDNTWEIQNAFEDFLSSSIKVLNKLSIMLWMILEIDIQTTTQLRKYLKNHSEQNIKDMINNDESNWSQLLAELRSASEHESSWLIKYHNYRVEKIFWEELPVVFWPTFQYKWWITTSILEYIDIQYFNLFTFIEDIIAIGINQKLSDRNWKMRLIKDVNDWGDLDSVESVYTLHMI